MRRSAVSVPSNIAEGYGRQATGEYRHHLSVRFSFEESHLTHFGGMWLIQRFCNKLRLKKRLQDYVRLPQRRSEYHSSAMILALLYAIIMGLRRINKTDILQYNGAFLEMLGLNRFPDQSTLRRFLKRLLLKASAKSHGCTTACAPICFPCLISATRWSSMWIPQSLSSTARPKALAWDTTPRSQAGGLTIPCFASRKVSRSSGMAAYAQATPVLRPVPCPFSKSVWLKPLRPSLARVCAFAWTRVSIAAV